MLDAIKSTGNFACLFKDNEILTGGEKVLNALRGWNRGPTCSICKESWFDEQKQRDATMCNRCLREKQKAETEAKDKNKGTNADVSNDKNKNHIYTFSAENNMIPGPIPDELKDLNNIEEAAIKLIKPFLHIYRRKGGGVGFSGNCISFAQNIESFTKSLPWSVKDLTILVIHSENDINKTFNANGNKIRNALKWLKKKIIQNMKILP